MASVALPEPEVDTFFLPDSEIELEESSDPDLETDETTVDVLAEILDQLEEIDGEG